MGGGRLISFTTYRVPCLPCWSSSSFGMLHLGDVSTCFLLMPSAALINEVAASNSNLHTRVQLLPFLLLHSYTSSVVMRYISGQVCWHYSNFPIWKMFLARMGWRAYFGFQTVDQTGVSHSCSYSAPQQRELPTCSWSVPLRRSSTWD